MLEEEEHITNVDWHVLKGEERYGVRFVPEQYISFVLLAVVLANFGSFFGQNPIREKKVGTYMIAIAMFILVWSSPPYFLSRWKAYNKLHLLFFALTIVAIFVGFVWLALRIWFTF